MNFPSEPLDRSVTDSVRTTLEPFDPNRSVTTDQRAWLTYFGVNRGTVSMGTVTAEPNEIMVYRFEPEHPTCTVVLIPGFLDHALVHGNVINDLLDRHCTVITGDLPGHGLSSGHRGSTPDFRHYGIMAAQLLAIAFTTNRSGPIHCMGHSTGCSAILELLRTEGKTWNGETLFIAPLIRSPLWHISRIGLRIAGSLVRQTPRNFQITSHDRSFLKFLKTEPLRIETFEVEWFESLTTWAPLIEMKRFSDMPLTVVQGTQDFTVGWKTNMKLIRKMFDRAEITIIPRGRHHLLNESEEYSRPVYEIIHSTLRLTQ